MMCRPVVLLFYFVVIFEGFCGEEDAEEDMGLRGRKKQEDGKNFILRIFMISIS